MHQHVVSDDERRLRAELVLTGLPRHRRLLAGVLVTDRCFCRLHDVRHTAATMLLDGGTTPSATAKWLGHDPAITLRVYGHFYDDALASAGDALLGRSRATGDR